MTRTTAVLGAVAGAALLAGEIARRRGYRWEIRVTRPGEVYEAPDLPIHYTTNPRLIDEVRAELDEAATWPTKDPLPGSELLADEAAADEAEADDTDGGDTE